MKYVPPKFQKESFTCPHCGVLSQQSWQCTHFNRQNAGNELATAYCYHCRLWSVWVEGRIVSPNRGMAQLPNHDMPLSVKEDYEEAASIATLSPKGAAALLRLAIQKLCIELGEKGKNINDDISALVKKGLNPGVQEALDIVRVIGNNAVHPGQIETDDPAVATTLFELVNFIVDAMITHPKKVKAMYSILPPTILDGIKKRDGR